MVTTYVRIKLWGSPVLLGCSCQLSLGLGALFFKMFSACVRACLHVSVYMYSTCMQETFFRTQKRVLEPLELDWVFGPESRSSSRAVIALFQKDLFIYYV